MTTPRKTGAAKKASSTKTGSKPAGRLPAPLALSEDVPVMSERANGAVVLYTPPPVNDPAKRGRSGVAIADVDATPAD